MKLTGTGKLGKRSKVKKLLAASTLGLETKGHLAELTNAAKITFADLTAVLEKKKSLAEILAAKKQ